MPRSSLPPLDLLNWIEFFYVTIQATLRKQVEADVQTEHLNEALCSVPLRTAVVCVCVCVTALYQHHLHTGPDTEPSVSASLFKTTRTPSAHFNHG